MFGNRQRHRYGRVTAVVTAGLLAAGLAACSNGGAPSASGSSASAKTTGGVVMYALPPSTTPNWILPFESITYASVYNTNQFQQLRPSTTATRPASCRTTSPPTRRPGRTRSCCT